MPSPGGAAKPPRGAFAQTSSARTARSSTASAGSRPPLAPFDLDLRALDAFGIERLYGVRGARDESLRVLVRREVRENPLGERSRVAALRAADANPEPQELLRLQVLRNR